MAAPGKNIHSETTLEIDKKEDMEFDCERVRELYTTKVIMYLKGQTIDFDSPWDRKIIDELIEDVNNGKECIKMHLTRTGDQYRAMKKYSTCQTSTGKYTLLLKSIKQHQIIPCEESFDVVMRAHRTIGHRLKKKIYDHLCLTHVLPKWCVDIMEQVCNVCQKYRSDKFSLKYSEKGNVEIINIPRPDEHFKYVLIYEDMSTKYVHVRALDKKDEDELAMVLMQIFMNFGSPMYLNTSDKELFRLVLKTVNMMCRLPCEVFVDSQKSMTSHLEIIEAKILKWMTENKTDHWSLGCQIVQWEHNNTSLDNRLSPYELVFGQTSNTNKYKSTIEDIDAVDEISDANKKLCKQCNTSLTDLIYICCRCNKTVHRICCEFLLCFSCRDKENLLYKLKAAAKSVQQLINKGT